jgi:hypothetical protein
MFTYMICDDSGMNPILEGPMMISTPFTNNMSDSQSDSVSDKSMLGLQFHNNSRADHSKATAPILLVNLLQ